HTREAELQGPVVDGRGSGVGDGDRPLHTVTPVIDHGVVHRAGAVTGAARFTRTARTARLTRTARTARLTRTAAGGVAAESLVDRVPGGLAVVLAVVEQRSTFTREGVGHPGALVVDTPDGDTDAAGHREAGVDHGLVVAGLLLELVLVGRHLHADVQLGDGHVQAEVSEPLDVLLERGRHLADDQVGLDTDTVDRHTVAEQVDHQVVEAVALSVDAFDVVVVDVQLGVGVDLVRLAERVGDVVATHAAVPDRVAERTVLVERFVDHVPGVDVTPVASGHHLDVVLHDGPELAAGEAAVVQPGRQLAVPDQGVAAHNLVVGLGEVDDVVG